MKGTSSPPYFLSVFGLRARRLKFNDCIIDKLRGDLKSNKSTAVEYMRTCFDSVLQDNDFLNWLSVTVGFKPYGLRMLLSKNRPNKLKITQVLSSRYI